MEIVALNSHISAAGEIFLNFSCSFVIWLTQDPFLLPLQHFGRGLGYTVSPFDNGTLMNVVIIHMFDASTHMGTLS